MMSSKDLKKKAKREVKSGYFRTVLLVFICSLCLAGGFNYTTKNILEVDIRDKKVEQLLSNKRLTSSEILDELLEKTKLEKKLEIKVQNKYTKGVISYFINELVSSRSLVFTSLNVFNKIFFHNKISMQITIVISSILVFIISILFIQVLEIGKCRYFLEKRRYLDTKIDRLLFPYRVRKIFHLSYILFVKSWHQFLWNFTIIGGVIKHYEYKFIPYLLAENPNITKKDAFLLAKQLTSKEKWNLFLIDLSLIGWNILKICTLNLSGIFYSDIYKETLYAEAYMSLRQRKKDTLSKGYLLNDSYLESNDLVTGSYPEDKFSIPVGRMNRLLKVDYDKDYDLKTYILFFMTFSIIGYLWEVFLHLLSDGTFVNRGTMHGPWLPIYGTGGVLILFLLKKYRDNPLCLFLATFFLCGIVEYGTAWYLETFKHLKYWDYTGYFLNIKGRICLEGLLVFGLGGCGFTYIVAPVLDNFYKKFNVKILNIFCIVFLLLFSTDFIYSSFYPNMGSGISKEILTEK